MYGTSRCWIVRRGRHPLKTPSRVRSTRGALPAQSFARPDPGAVRTDLGPLDDERVIVLDRPSGRGKISGLEIGQAKSATLFQIRGGKVTRLVLYWDRNRMFADLGLATESGPQPAAT